MQVPNPSASGQMIDIMLYPVEKCKVNVKILNGSPLIDINCNFIGRIYSMDNNSKYLNNEELKEISSQVNSYLQIVFVEYLYKTSLQFKSDINSFGKYAAKNFLTLGEFEQYDWRNNYQNSIFKVHINTNVESGFLVTET